MSVSVPASHVFTSVSASSVDEVLRLVADKAVQLGMAEDADALLAALRQREGEGTTGMVGGFAIPHAKSELVREPCVLVLRLRDGIEWSSMDGKPVTFVIALLIPAGQAGTTYLELLSRVAVLLMDEAFRVRLLGLGDAEGISGAISEGLAQE